MTKAEVVKMLIKKAGCGLPEAIKIYNKLTANGFYTIEKKELNDFIKKNW